MTLFTNSSDELSVHLIIALVAPDTVAENLSLISFMSSIPSSSLYIVLIFLSIYIS